MRMASNLGYITNRDKLDKRPKKKRKMLFVFPLRQRAETNKNEKKKKKRKKSQQQKFDICGILNSRKCGNKRNNENAGCKRV